jgi:hypothetical protein
LLCCECVCPEPPGSQEHARTRTHAHARTQRERNMGWLDSDNVAIEKRPAAPQQVVPTSGVPIRPLQDRARDYGILVGGGGSIIGACLSTHQHASAFVGALYGASVGGVLAASFIGLRHALLQGRFEDDREAVSGLAAGTIALTVRTVTAGPRSGAIAGTTWFVGGCVLHHAHRWWLHHRLVKGW